MTRTTARATTRRRATIAAFAVATGTLSLPFAAQPAAAATAGERQVLLVSSSTGSSIVSRSVGAVDATGDRTLVPVVSNLDYSDLSTSADGSRFTYVASTYTNASPVPVREQVVVRDISGNLVRTPESSTVADLYSPALSPDGAQLVWVRDGGTPTLRAATVTAGVAVDLPGTAGVAFDDPAFLNASTLVFTDVDGMARTLPVTGGTAKPLAGVSTGGPLQFEVNATGTKLAWSLDTTVASASVTTHDVYLADLDLTGSTPVVSGAKVFATGQDNEDPSFSADGLSLSFITYAGTRTNGSGDAGPGDVFTGPVDGSSAPVASPATPALDELQVDGGLVDTVAPTSPATLTSFTLAGTTAALRWTLPTDAPDVSGVCVLRALGTTAPVPGDTCATTRTGSRAFFAPGSAGTDTDLTVGQTYTYVVQPVDRSGNLGPASAAKSLVATATPTFTTADPTSTTSATTTFPVAFNPLNAAGTTTAAYYRRLPTTSFSLWRATTSPVASFGSGGSPVVVKPGDVVEFRGYAQDHYGNRTAPVTGARRAVVPFNQTKATFTTSVASVRSSSRWLGDLRVLSRRGQVATVTVSGNRLQIIGDRRADGGRFDVYARSSSGSYTRVAAGVSTYGSATRVRQVLYTRSLTTATSHTFQLRWVPGTTTARRNVALDGFAVRR